MEISVSITSGLYEQAKVHAHDEHRTSAEMNREITRQIRIHDEVIKLDRIAN